MTKIKRDVVRVCKMTFEDGATTYTVVPEDSGALVDVEWYEEEIDDKTEENNGAI